MTQALEIVEVARRDDGISILTMNRPTKLNAMSAQLVTELHAALDALAADRSCRVVILTGAGRGFCAGLDLGGFGDAPNTEGLGRVQRGLAGQKHIATLIPRLRSLPQPVIAAVNGPAAGGGPALALGSDIRIAARSARFNVAFVRIGLSGCDIGTRLAAPPHRRSRASSGADADGKDLRFGRGAQDRSRGRRGRGRSADGRSPRQGGRSPREHPAAVAMTKEAMWSALEIPSLQCTIDLENRQQIMLSATDDHVEAMSAFVERRDPVFHNR